MAIVGGVAMEDCDMSPVVRNPWGCREVAVYWVDALEKFFGFQVRNAAIENNTGNVR